MHRQTITAIVSLVVLAMCGCTPASDGPAATSPGGTPAASSGPASETAGPTGDAAASESSDPSPGAYLEYTDGAIEGTAGPKVLFFHASWCPKCRALDEQLRAEGAPEGLTVFKVDYDSRTDLREKYGVTLQTTVVFVDDRGEPISSTVLYDDPSIESLLAARP